MNFDNIFRSFFGFNGPENRSNPEDGQFSDPRYFGDNGPHDEDGADSRDDFFGQPRFYHFTETDDMSRHFDDMFKNFEEVFKGMGMAEFPGSQPGAPGIEGPKHRSGSLRDHMLKEPDKEDTTVITPQDPYHHHHHHPGLFGGLWGGMFGGHKPTREDKLDTDLDDEVSSGNLDQILRVPRREQWMPHNAPTHEMPRSNFSYSVRKYTNANGKVEETRTEKLPDGTTQTTVTRSLGDKTYSVTTKEDTQGGTEKSEDFVNIDENEKGAFDRLWRESGSNQGNRALLAPHTPRDDIVGSEREDERSIFKNIFGIDFPNFRR